MYNGYLELINYEQSEYKHKTLKKAIERISDRCLEVIWKPFER